MSSHEPPGLDASGWFDETRDGAELMRSHIQKMSDLSSQRNTGE